MIRFTAIRLVEIAAMLVLMSFVIYALIGLMPGDPIDLMRQTDPQMSAADVAQLKALYGLDQPLIERYLTWAHQALGGDLGYSRLFAAPVWSVLAAAARQLSRADGVEFCSGTDPRAGPWHGGSAAAEFAASTPRSILFCFAGVSMPTFWLALVLILVFAAGLGWLPASGIATAGVGDLGDRLRHLVLPVATLTLASIGGYTRYVRAAMREALAQDHVRTARAKGASEARVICIMRCAARSCRWRRSWRCPSAGWFRARWSPRRCLPIPAWAS